METQEELERNCYKDIVELKQSYKDINADLKDINADLKDINSAAIKLVKQLAETAKLLEQLAVLHN